MVEIDWAAGDVLTVECLHQQCWRCTVSEEDSIFFFALIRFCERGLSIRLAMLN
jgi:hypothetical protein